MLLLLLLPLLQAIENYTYATEMDPKNRQGQSASWWGRSECSMGTHS